MRISNNTMLFVLYRRGYKGKMTVHGGLDHFDERGGLPDVIERQLAHAGRNEVRAAYNCPRVPARARQADACLRGLRGRDPTRPECAVFPGGVTLPPPRRPVAAASTQTEAAARGLALRHAVLKAVAVRAMATPYTAGESQRAEGLCGSGR